MEPTLRRALPRDSAALTALAHAAKRHWGYPESWIEAWREELTLSPAMLAEHRVFLVEDEEGAAVACYALSTSPDGAFQLEHMWVHPDSIGRGLGRRLFEHATGLARGLGATALLLDSDPHAEAFYLRMGAVRVGALRADIEGVRRELPQMRFEIDPRENG